jgi:chorismate--pyruvate lyase
MLRKPRNAKWHAHVNAVNAPAQIRRWLTDRKSLTMKLMEQSEEFRVQCLHQERARSLVDESAEVGLIKCVSVHEREVLLRCDDVPVVFAHTVVPLSATASDWPFFSSLGNRSLGSTLFGDPQVVRGSLQFARLSAEHPLVRRVCKAVGLSELSVPLYARRCLFKRKNGLLLVTEIFLPSLFRRNNQ